MCSFKTKKNSGQIVKALMWIGLFLSPLSLLAEPKEVLSSAVESCSYVDTIRGTSGYGKKFEWKSYAKTDALNKADQRGASHIVWESFNPVGAFNGLAVAKVYKCNT